MKTFYQKLSVLFIAAFGLMALPLHAQQTEAESKQPFIEQGRFLTGFSLAFTNASEDYSNPQFGEYTRLLIELDGLYFVSDHVGIGPVLGYRFNFWGEPVDQNGENMRQSNFLMGAQIGWYTLANKLFSTSSLGRAQFFVDAGVSWLRSQGRVGGVETGTDYLFGYQMGMGFLFPVGERIAIETRLGFHSRKEEMLIGQNDLQWMSDLGISVGFKVTL